MKSNTRRTIIVIGALMSGLLIGTTGSAIAIAGSGEGLPLPAMGAYSGDGEFPRNERGQTYGASIDASSPENEPDLILATGRDFLGGFVDGYVLKNDLNQVLKEGESVVISLYLSDGSTVVGEFHLGGGVVSGNQPHPSLSPKQGP